MLDAELAAIYGVQTRPELPKRRPIGFVTPEEKKRGLTAQAATPVRRRAFAGVFEVSGKDAKVLESMLAQAAREDART